MQGVWQRIHHATGKPRPPAVTKVEVKENGTTVIKSSKDEVETHVIEGVSARFRSTEGTPLRSGPIAASAGLLGETDSAQAILDGTFVPPEGTDPHTQAMLTADVWEFPYTRQQAAFPLDYIADNKFWPSVRRVDDAYGDRNLICTCAPIEAYQEA